MQQYVVVVNEGHANSDAFVDYLRRRLTNVGLRVQELEQPQSAFQTRASGAHAAICQELLVVEPSNDLLLKEASRAKLKKETHQGELREFDLSRRSAFKNVGRDDFLLPFEKQHIIGSILDRIQIDKGYQALIRGFGNEPTPTDTSDPLLLTLTREGFIETVTPVHNTATVRRLWNDAKWRLFIPATAVRDYFGEQVAFYCAWINFYTRCLLVPGLAGALLFAYNSLEGYTVENSPYIPFFSFFMVLWSAIFMKLWKRKSSQIACDWDTLDEAKRVVVRPGFKGRMRKSPVTDKDELFYPSHYRFLKYCVSAAVSAVLLSFAFILLMLSLNLQGYVRSTSSLFYVESLSKHARPGPCLLSMNEQPEMFAGGIFDPTSQVMRFVPVVLHVITIQTLNRIYRWVASVLTNWENHRTEQSHESSLILKRFFFEAFDSYIAMFYLAFAERNISKVRLELSSLYMVDCLRRLGTELILPILLQLPSSRRMKQEIEALKKKTGEKVVHQQAVADTHRDAYEEFDDFLEMAIAFGYITMFGSAFPFAAFVQIVYNLIEMKSDMYKLCFVVQRPPVVRANSVGSWQFVLQTQSWLSLFTNVLLFVFSSDRMENWCSMHSMPKMGCMCLGLFALEHVLGAVIFMIFEGVDNTPESVKTRLARQKFLREEGGSSGFQ